MIEIEHPTSPPVPAKIAAVVLDWAGTTVDFGSRAPVAAMRAVFEHAGVAISEQEARRPMGKAKREHIAALLDDPEIRERWRSSLGRTPDESDLDRIYTQFLSMQADSVAEFSGVIEGCVEAIAECRRMGLKIGSSTGYTRELLAKVAQRAAREGYVPDVMLSADDLSPGRPAPWLCLENARRLGVYPMAAIVKVDDTPAGILAGRNAGMWTVGVVASGNEVGLSYDALAKLGHGEREGKLTAARQSLTQAGAHYLIDTIAELPEAIQAMNLRLSEGRLP